jgi:hypothetical protein
MSLSDSPFDDDEELIKEINQLREIGLIEVVGIDDDGEWLYGPTEEGKNLAEAFRNFFQLGQDDE